MLISSGSLKVHTNNAIGLVDSATDTFLGFIGQGHFTGSRPCPGQPKELRHCAGPNGVVTDDLGHVWAGDGDGNIIEADATKPGTAIIRSIPTGGKGRVDEMAYDPINRILYAENDGDTPPRVTFVSVTDGAVLGHYVYPMDQDGMEQPVWVRQTGLFYQNVPGKKNRIDVFDPHKLPNPVKSFPVECTGGLLGLTVSGLAVGPSTEFSIITTAPSTIIPKSIAPRLIRFALMPNNRMPWKLIGMENGIIAAVIKAARRLPRNSSRTTATGTKPSNRFFSTVWMVLV